MTITDATSTVQAIFSLHVATAGCALLLLIASGLLYARQFAGGPGRPRMLNKLTKSNVAAHSSSATHICLMSGLFNLMAAYATQAAIVALQTSINSPYYITSAYAYPSYTTNTIVNDGTQYGKIISILSFLYQAANILANVSIVGAIWIHANHLQHNGTGIREPGILSWIWNALWIAAILGLGFASWARGLQERGSGNSALAYPALISSNYIIRTLYVVYVVVVVVSSTSATVEAVLCWFGIKANGVAGNTARPALTRLVMMITPLVFTRNAFSIAQVVLIYKDVNNWSRTTNQALAFLFIIFGELSNLAILFVLLWGAWSFGRKEHVAPTFTKEVRERDSVSSYSRRISQSHTV
ncbi:hypothetical protein T440DRAFT_498309 [Plenodomus tracheiphilus IPT5]|uniref:Uncharacterized protein n=1 Tax=Plenodomus tracheiphilus IPT5 TaxID=1408161 RepID=A0A6A7B9B1_9PLEO|nr:hypothetical protein T440DRAFT_498309 [Plenodomus tracheiphilus IPT5]